MTDVVEVIVEPTPVVEVVTSETTVVEVVEAGPQGPAGAVYATFTRTGALEVATGSARWYPPNANGITQIEAWLSVAPVGGDVVWVLNKNGAQIATGTIAAGEYVMTAQTELALALLTTDYLTVDITGVGSTTPGSNLSMRIKIG